MSGGEFTDIRGRKKVLMGRHHFSDPYKRVKYPDGVWEELNRPEINRGKELATASA